jgi:Arc/MetJ family transcription regulator
MATSSRGSASVRRLGRPPRGWVRKNLHIDQRKLNVARKALGVKTETEAVDAALDAIAFRQEISQGIRRLRAAGGLKDIYQD